jgi:hypothetical protein
MAANTETGNGMMGITGFLFSVCGEKKPDNGEDSFVYALNESRAMVGVFDGGPGAGQSPALKGKSGGYLASRAAAAAYLHWFEALQPGQENGAEDVKERLRQYLRLCREQAGADFAGRLSASGAAAICRPARGGADVQLQWAGDSRVYLLDGAGLAQLTEDDTGGLDAMQRQSQDKAPTNGIRLNGDFSIHTAGLTVNRPCLLFAAAGGCFGQLSTPMEFEYLLLSTLQNAPNAESWEKNLAESIGKGAEDDYSLCGIALNAGSFDELKRQLAGRTSQLYRTYIRGLDACTAEEKLQLWEHYKAHYHRLLCRV